MPTLRNNNYVKAPLNVRDSFSFGFSCTTTVLTKFISAKQITKHKDFNFILKSRKP